MKNIEFKKFKSTGEIEKEFNTKCVHKCKVGDILYFLKEDNTQVKCPIVELKIVAINFDEEDCFVYYDCEEDINGEIVLNRWDYDEESELYNTREDAVKVAIANFKNRINEIELEKENVEENIKLCV